MLISGWVPKGRLIGGSPIKVDDFLISSVFHIFHSKNCHGLQIYKASIFKGEPTALSMEGPLRGLFLFKLPPNTTVHVIDDQDCILPQPFGKEAKTVTTSDIGGYVFFQAKGGFCKVSEKKR